MVAALIASAAIVFGSPYVGRIRGAVQSAFPDDYRLIIGGGVVVALLAAIVAAAARIARRRQDRVEESSGGQAGVRYALMATAVVVGVVYGWSVSSGNLDIDLVEHFHFVEYGAVTYLFYRAWRRRTDAGVLVLPTCAAFAVGVSDELVQWFVPGRVGELHDVWLNAVAIVCGLLFSMAIDPPRSLAMPAPGGPRLAVAAAVAALVLAVAVFVDRVHLGYEIRDNDARTFRSHWDATSLLAAAAERATRRSSAPPAQSGFTREDHYLSEGQWHVQHRNDAEGDGDYWIAWNENLILERFYAPVLASGSRWSSGQREQIQLEAADGLQSPYVSEAAPYPIYTVNRGLFWAIAGLIAAAIVWICRPHSAAPAPVA